MAVFVIAVFCMSALAWTWSHAQDKQPVKISVLIITGMPGSTYHRVGLGMASLWTTKLRQAGIRVSAAISEGSGENIEAIRIADADLILAESIFCSMAYGGTGLFKGKPVSELRSVCALWPDAVHYLIRSEAKKSGNIEDLSGLTLAAGLSGSGNRFTAELVLRAQKSANGNVKLKTMSDLSAAEALRNGTVQSLNITGGIPVPLVTRVFSEEGPRVQLLEVPDDCMRALVDAGWKHLFREVIPANTYPGQLTPVKTVGLENMLATTASMDPQVVYALTRTLYENLDSLIAVHPACKSLSLDRALAGIDVPLHRGAAQYYRERNIVIPPNLVE